MIDATPTSHRLRVAVVRGGSAHGYDDSLETGAQVLNYLRERPARYDPVDIFVNKNGDWHRSGRVDEPHRALRHSDVVFNVLSGNAGESGSAQRLFTELHLPHTGTGPVGSALSYHKDLARNAYATNGLRTLRHEVLLKDTFDESRLGYIFRNFMHPVRVRPVGMRANLAQIAYGLKDLDEAVRVAFTHSPKILVEEWVRGQDAFSGVVEGLRGEMLYALMPTPADFSTSTHRKIEDIAKQAHRALGLRHFSSSHFIVTPQQNVYIVESHTIPSLSRSSWLLESLRAVGLKSGDFIEHLLNLSYGV